MLNSLAGNEELKQSLLAALSGGRLSHSVLLCGEDGTGVNYAARCLAADYLYPSGGAQADAIMRGEGAECIILQGEGASGDIKIDAVRAARREVYNTSISAGGRCVLVRGAHKLNGPAANAVLKVLEEPPENVLFILTAQSEAAVLPTIRSRCAVYTISAPSNEICTKFLENIGTTAESAAKLATVFSGRIGLAKRIIEDEAENALFSAAQSLCSYFESKNEISAGALLVAYEKDKPSAQRLIMYTRILIAATLFEKGGSKGARALNALYEAGQQLARNASPKLVFTVLAANLAA